MQSRNLPGSLGILAMTMVSLMLAGCQTMPDPMDNAGNSNSNNNGNDNTATDPNDPGASPIQLTSNSITKADGGERSDPEGVAAKSKVTELTWKDARGADRTMTLGGYLYQYDFSFDDNQNIIQRSVNDDAWGHEGFGYVVSHNDSNGNSPIGKANAPTNVSTTIFAGGHHAIHRVELLYDRDKEGGGMGIKIPVVIEWFVATGRDHPVWAVNWKLSEIINPNNVNFSTYRMDSRGPYGSLNFDGAATRNAGDAIGGVAWGDAGFRFETTDAQLTMMSPWTYNAVNIVNFTRSWTANVNAEMGIVQTRTNDKTMGYPDRVDGRERGKTSAVAFADKGDCNGFGDARAYTMPCVNGWPYQLMNFDWDPGTGKPLTEATGTKIIAWGTPYGFLGADSFTGMDGATADGRGDRSYSTFIVLGPKSRFNAASGKFDLEGDVMESIAEVEALSSATISNVTTGTLVTQRPVGPGSDEMKTVANGYDDTYAAYFLTADSDRAAFTFTPAAGKPIANPIFVIRDYKADRLPKVTVDNADVTVNNGADDSGTFVSIDRVNHELWITLNRDVSAATSIVVAAE
ncbi:MAG: hypothetical protein H6819_11280 [Phycisphaerales bacterium]|nr:hypothetical protein [Phycisphaerales bacterium]MCB9854559.1 hypothetical protein [Phycisphaerales bacterium]MCB9863214.1 hypothetical protein [Phycisphaerales bacterium]